MLNAALQPPRQADIGFSKLENGRVVDETSFEAGEFNNREEFAKNRFKDKRTAWSVCGKLYKKELLLAAMTQFEISVAIQKTRFLAFWFGKRRAALLCQKSRFTSCGCTRLA